jgi:hypothetical protein
VDVDPGQAFAARRDDAVLQAGAVKADDHEARAKEFGRMNAGQHIGG